MDESRRVILRGVAAFGVSCVAAKALSLQGAIAATEVPSNESPVIDEQPPETATFMIGVPASIPYGRGHHPNADRLRAGLEVLPQGFSTSLVGDQIMLHWDGVGTIGTYQVRAFLDDGK
jgi:hypothetical protein